MISLPHFRLIFSTRSPFHEWRDGVTLPEVAGLTPRADDQLGTSTLGMGDYVPPVLGNWMKIRFDNMVRLAVSTISYLLCAGLWLGGAVPSMLPITLVYLAYGSLGFFTTWGFLGSRRPVVPDYLLCTYDVLAITAAVHLTGGPTSPLYFVYFVPLIIQALHRNSALLLYEGVGGVCLYTIVAVWGQGVWSGEQLTEIGARMLFMLMGVGVAAFAVTLMRRRDETGETRLARMRLLNYIQQVLNQVSMPIDLKGAAADIVEKLSQEFSRQMGGWCRMLLTDDNGGLMHAVEPRLDPKPELKQELPVFSCPAISAGSAFELHDAETEAGCPIENFSFGSHVCIPVIGTESETFGVIFAGARRAKAFGHEETQFLRIVGKALGLTIQRLQRMEELRKAWEMDTCAMASFMKSARSVDDTVGSILDGMTTLVTSDHTTVMLWSPGAAALKTVAIRSPFNFPEQPVSLGLGEGVPGRVLETGEPLLTNDTRNDPRYKNKAAAVRSVICLPLRTLRGEPLGVITALRIDDNKPFSLKEFDIAATFATRAALALENASLHESKRSQLKEALEGKKLFRVA